MLYQGIKWILILLFIFTPIAFGSMDIWAFSLMELGILLIISLYVIQESFFNHSFAAQNSYGSFLNLKKNSAIPLILLCFFLAFILFQMIPLPAGVIKILSPKAYELRQQLLSINSPLQALSLPNPHNLWPTRYPLSISPYATEIEFFKWFALIGFFIFLLYGRFLDDYKIRSQLVIVIMLVGIGESLYGMIEFFSGHHHILYLDGVSLMSTVTGTFINRNYFAGYLLMVIPLSMGFLLSRLAVQTDHFGGWRHSLSSLDGKDLLIGFGVILMILGLLFSASRMGIISLLLSFSLLGILFRDPKKEKRFSKTPTLLLGLALLWAGWIGLDAVISGFFNVAEGFKMRQMIWVDTFRILKDFPILGSGLGTFPQVFPMYRSFHIQGLVTHADNDFLQLASECGVIGMIPLLILFIFLIHKAFLGIRSLPTGVPQRYITVGGLVGIFALMIHSIIERNIQIPANAFLFAFLCGLVLKISTSTTIH